METQPEDTMAHDLFEREYEPPLFYYEGDLEALEELLAQEE